MKIKVAIGVVLSVCFACMGGDRWWIGNASSDPTSGSSWWGGVPSESDNAYVNDGATMPMTITSGKTITCADFQMGVNQQKLDNAVTMNGGSLVLKGGLTVGFFKNSGGTFTQNDGAISTAKSMAIGTGENSVGSFVQNGGTISVAGSVYAGNGTNAQGTFLMTGGTTTVSGDFIINQYATSKGHFEMTGGTLNLTAGKSMAAPYIGEAATVVSGSSTVINFNGAYLYLAAARAWNKATSGTGAFTLSDGATMKGVSCVYMLGPDSSFISKGGVIVCSQKCTLFNSSGKLCIGNGGITIDTQSYDVTLGKPMLAAAGATSGGLVKRGAGTLRLTGSNTVLPGPVSIEAGKVVAYSPDAFPGYATESFSLAEGATLELGAGWSPAQVAAIKALPNVLGTVTRTSPLAVNQGDVEISDDLTAANVEAGDVANPKTGSSALKLTGHNDFGGEFAVEEGALVADWGEGLAWTDNLRLGLAGSFGTYKSGKFAPICGLVTNDVGTGAGKIFFPANAEAGFAGYVQPTVVRLYDDATHALKVDADLPRMLTVNTTTLTNDVHLQNPVELNATAPSLDVWVDAGHFYLDGTVAATVDGAPSTSKGTLAKKGSGTLHMPSTSTFSVLYTQGGLVEFPENGQFTAGALYSTSSEGVTRFPRGCKASLAGINNMAGLIQFEEGSELEEKGGIKLSGAARLVVSNSTVRMTAGDFIVDNGTAVFKDCAFTNTSGGWTYTRGTGHLTFDGGTASFKASAVAGYDGSGTNFCGKTLLAFTGGVQAKAPACYAMNGDMEISGEGTRVITTDVVYAGGGHTDVCTNRASVGRIFVKGGSLEPGGNVNAGDIKGSVAEIHISGGVVKMASDKSMCVGNFGNGLIEVSGGLLDASAAYGIVMLPHWGSGSGTVRSDWSERGMLRFNGGETRVKQIFGVSGRDCHVIFDGGRVTFVNPSATTIFNNVATRQIGVNGGEIDTGTANLTMFGAFSALTNQTSVAATGTALNTAPAFAKSGTGTLTLKGENTYSCGTEVKAGTLALASGASLSADRFLRVGAGAVLDLGGNSQTVTALLGTGNVKTGSLTVTDAIYPAGVGTVGTLTLTDVVPAGRVVIDVAADGSYDKLIVNGKLDASKLTISFADPEVLKQQRAVRFLEATEITGVPVAENLPRNYTLSVSKTKISAVHNGFVIICR